MSKLIKNDYNPDILETIANLSNDEVFTPPDLARDMLDMLPEEIWSDSTITFLDPAVKTGIFLREITSRLINGLADEIPDLQERVNHILTKQVFGLGITELTTLMSRRTVYCSTTANGKYSVCTEFDDDKGNILFPNTKHTFDDNGRCEYCGANRDNYEGKDGSENYAYPFIHENFEEVFDGMKFDVIIGNPPYQRGNGKSSTSSPLYNKFVDIAKELNPKYMSMITPSRWMKGGLGLKSFRESMIYDYRLSSIVDYEDSRDLFPDQEINGGISYFLWDRSKKDEKVHYEYNTSDGKKYEASRVLKVEKVDTIIRNPREQPIIEKVLNKEENFFDKIVHGGFGFDTDLFNNPKKYPNSKLSSKSKEGYNKIYGMKDNSRTYMYVENEGVPRNKDLIDKYKILFPVAFGTDTTLLPKLIFSEPGSLNTGTFLPIGGFNSKSEMNNCLSYMETRFFRALFQFNRASFISSQKNLFYNPIIRLQQAMDR